jgi:hypothetical protein
MRRVRIAKPFSALALAVAAIALGGCGEDGAEQRFERAVSEGYFGVNGQGLRPLAEDGDLETLDRHLDAIAAGGIEFIRANVDWPRLEPEPPGAEGHRYLFAGLDRWMAALSEHNLSWSVAVMGVPTPAWAADPGAASVCGSRAAPRRAADVAALAGALARRYGRGGSFWRQNPGLRPVPVTDYELWNEPNLGSFWCPVPDPRRFAEVAGESADAILAADRRAKLILGGLAAFHTTDFVAPGDARHAVTGFLERMLAVRPDLARKLDVIGVHAYGATPAGALERLAEQRAAVDAAGLARKPLTYNEVGWYTEGLGGTPPTEEETRAAYLAEVTSAVARSNCAIESFAPHTWVTAETDAFSIEDWYGIADPESGAPYDTGQAYIDQVLLFEGRGGEPPPADPVRLCR